MVGICLWCSLKTVHPLEWPKELENISKFITYIREKIQDFNNI